jgi:AraC-like DNA-binding protein
VVSYKKYLDIEIFEGEISKHRYPWHFHNCYTIVIVEQGSILYELQDKHIKVDATDLLILEPRQVHRNTISQSTIYKAVFVPGEYFEFDGQDKTTTRLVKRHKAHKKIIDLLGIIESNYNKKELKELIWTLLETINPPKTKQPDISPSGIKPIPAVNYDLTIKELAEEAQLSPFHFQRKFKRNYGLTIGQFKLQEKTTKAKTLLENKKLSTSVAYELGFFDQSHFIKYFKKMWAITPKNFK